MPYSLDEISDRMEIEQKIALYCHAIDLRDFDLLDDVFLPETSFDFTRVNNGFRDWTFMKKFMRDHWNLAHDFHIYANIWIRFNADRSEAVSLSKVYNPQGIKDDKGTHFYTAVGTYKDDWRRSELGWRSLARQWMPSWIEGDYPHSEPPGASLPKPGEI